MGARVALIDQHGAFLGVRQGRFILKVGREVKWELSPVELDSIVVITEGCSLSAAALSLATRFGVDLVFMRGNKPLARIVPYKYGTLMKNWALQLKLHESGNSLNVAKRFLEGKLNNQRRVLLEYSRRLRGRGRDAAFLDNKADEIATRLSELESIDNIDALVNVEAHAARSYWSAISRILPAELGFQHRYTRNNPPPDGETDPFNIALNIGYALLRKEVWRAVFLAGLNPYLGFLHKPRGSRPALVLDLMEEFRPVSVDRPLIGLARTDSKVILSLKERREDAYRVVWSHILKYMQESKPPHIELINSQARKLVLHLQGVHTYTPYKSRW